MSISLSTLAIRRPVLQTLLFLLLLVVAAVHVDESLSKSSPTYRALEPVKLAKLGQPITIPELGQSEQDMSADKSGRARRG